VSTVEPVAPKHKLEELLLPPPVLARLRDIKDEFRYAKWLDRHGDGMRPRNRFLFTGPPGNGKTAAAHGFAQYLGRKILCVNYGEMLSSFCNASAKNLAEAFNRIRGQKIVFFMDECDAMFNNRTQAQQAADLDANRTANVALMELDKLDPETIFIGATNLDENLDRAIMRRLGGFPIHFPPPTPEQRTAFIDRLIAKMGVFQIKANAEEARAVSAASFAEIAEQVNEVARRLIIRKAKEVDGQKVSNPTAGKIAANGRKASPQEKPPAAAHEKSGGQEEGDQQNGRQRQGGQKEKAGPQAANSKSAERGGGKRPRRGGAEPANRGGGESAATRRVAGASRKRDASSGSRRGKRAAG
jgi:SpoVK/Ycf46/Vps4 family AAA+-type ATPase